MPRRAGRPRAGAARAAPSGGRLRTSRRARARTAAPRPERRAGARCGGGSARPRTRARAAAGSGRTRPAGGGAAPREARSEIVSGHHALQCSFATRSRKASSSFREVARAGLGPAVRLLEQRVGVDAVLVELMPVDAHPVLHDLRRHLGVELDAEAAPDDVRLRADVGCRRAARARRRVEGVEVPLEPRALRDELGVAWSGREASRSPTRRRDSDVPPSARASSWPPKQMPSTGDAASCAAGGGRPRAGSTGCGRRRRELRPERDDQVVVARVDVALLDVDPELVDLGAALLEPSWTQPAGGSLARAG